MCVLSKCVCFECVCVRVCVRVCVCVCVCVRVLAPRACMVQSSDQGL